MKILAVSGGIDSVVMLHFLAAQNKDIIVAHFDHGIRPNSSEDAAFVERLASGYGLKFVLRRASLGENCSEATARSERYKFLEELSQQYNATICVAHHSDDVIESIAINLIRGTGWRGLAPMRAKNIERPLLGWRKKDIYRYACENNLHFRQDQTNTDSVYLRNRVREKLAFLPANEKDKILELYRRQAEIGQEVDELLADIVASEKYYSRNIAELDDIVAREILRFILSNYEISLTRPQLDQCLAAIREYLPGKRISIGPNRFILIGKYNFEIMI